MTSKELNDAIEQLEKLKELPNVVPEDAGTISVSEVGDFAIAAPSGQQTLQSLLKTMGVAGSDAEDDYSKKIFYWGWFWRQVDFDRIITLAWDEEGLTGFCENNKWNYPMHSLTKEESAELRRLCEEAVTHPSQQSVAEVNEYMSSRKPEDWKRQAEIARAEIDGMMREINKTH